MKVKICGLTFLKDSLVACEAGADMLGFNFYSKSSRLIAPKECKQIVEKIKSDYSNVKCVGVFVNHSLEQINTLMKSCNLDLAQLSGDESTNLLNDLGDRAFKAYRPKNMDELQHSLANASIRNSPPAFLLDTYMKGHYGGTGKTADWNLAQEISKDHSILLAGGLSLENIEAAVQQVRPWGVDVASGVENKPGIKDTQKVQSFIQLAKQAALSVNNNATLKSPALEKN